MKLTWEYIGEELSIFWESPYGHGKEKIASFWWPCHPPEKTEEVEQAFEAIAAWACLYSAFSAKSRCICNPMIPGTHAALCPANFPPAAPQEKPE